MKNYGKSFKLLHNPNWSYITDGPYQILIIGSPESGKTHVVLNLIKHQRQDSNKIILYVDDLFESKYTLLINERENVETKKSINQLIMFLKIQKAII